MYIPEFWCGVIATILAEVALVVIQCVIFGHDENDEREDTQ